VSLEKRWPHQDDFNALVEQASARYGVPVALIKAVISLESEFLPRAFRDEPKIGDASRGLMQLLLGTARALGYTGDAEGLFDPATSIDLGTRLLRDDITFAKARGFGLDSAVSAYNGGFSAQRPGDGKRTGDTVDTPFINAGYVSVVLERMQYFQQWDAQRASSGSGGVPPGAAGAIALLAIGALSLGVLT
jgi:soluble lytic murein transglycosylase-like protein